MKKRIIRILAVILFLASLILFLITLYINKKFGVVPFEQLLYTLKFSKGADSKVIYDALKYIVPRCILLVVFFFTIQYLINKFLLKEKRTIILSINTKKKTKEFKIFNFSKIKRIIYYIVIVIFIFLYTVNKIGLGKYIYMKLQTTKIYEEYYVNPKNVEIKFPEKKRNLIYIVVESQEITNLSRENGGGVKESYIPNEEKLALENTNFSNTNKLGGAIPVNGTTYTAASLVAQTSGAPITMSINGNDYHGYSSSYPGLYTLGEVFEKNGYKNYFLLGSDADFGGRSDYFEQHGNYKIMDYKYAKEHKWIKKDYDVWWGFEDKKLFQFAKNELKQISKNQEPFNFTILTADTHFTDGYLDSSCKNNKFDTQYKNVFYCNDKLIYDFVRWVQKQDFYKNTTIIITGDHLTMQGDFYEGIIGKNYDRTVYNTIINSAIKDESRTNKRKFTVLDFYPTTLAAIGAKIDGNRLGLGTNLYSDEETLVEKLGLKYVNQELAKRSDFYNDKILGKTYYESVYDENKE